MRCQRALSSPRGQGQVWRCQRAIRSPRGRYSAVVTRKQSTGLSADEGAGEGEE